MAEEALDDIHKLRTEYEGKKVESLGHLQELINKLKWIDNKMLEVDIHIGKILHVIEKSVLSVPPPPSLKKKKRLSLKEVCNPIPVVTGSECSSLASHFVRIGADAKADDYPSDFNHLCVVLD